jgi:rhodanese-related sulfurtransferase
LELQREGAQLLDTRDATEFGAAHLAGSINIGLGGQYATWAGTILTREQPIVIIANPGAEHESALRLGRIGFDHVVGYLQDGVASLASRPDLTRTTKRLSPGLASELIARGEVLPVDVRSPAERDAKRIQDSVGIPLTRLKDRLNELPKDRPMLVHCAGGYRSSIAASLLEQAGITGTVELAGGVAAWEAAHLPVLGRSSAVAR